MTWRLADLPDIVEGAWAATPPDAVIEAPFAGVSIDSRTIRAGEVFIAMRGAQSDGHAYVEAALDARAPVAIALRDQRDALKRPERAILVEDTLEALWKLAGAWRASLDGATVIAVTGSNGKTTTCRLIHAALSSRWRGVRSRRSFNNHLGVPLTLLQARHGVDFIVCEIGANAPGEIAALGKLAQPDIAVITSIGRAHVGGFGSLEAILREKSSLASCVSPGGVVFAPETPPALVAALDAMAVEIALVGHGDQASVRLVRAGHEETTDEHRLRIDLADGASFAAPVLGRHNAMNMALAVAVARRLGLRDAEIQRGLQAVELPAMRQQVMEISGVRVFNDAYNANPDSMRAAIATFLDLTRDAARRVLVLGDMLELGDHSPEAHAEILKAALADRSVNRVITVGGEFARAGVEPESRLRHEPAPTEDAIVRIAAELRTGDALLLKGSRLMRLERVVDALGGKITASGAMTP